jgi:CheY-like chemotaxis protein
MQPRILVVNDEPIVRALIDRVLTDEGYEVVSVADGKAAVEAVRGADLPFDLVVTNILHVDDLPTGGGSIGGSGLPV